MVLIEDGFDIGPLKASKSVPGVESPKDEVRLDLCYEMEDMRVMEEILTLCNLHIGCPT